MQVKDIFNGRKKLPLIPEIMIASAVQSVLSTQESNNRPTVRVSFDLDLSHCLKQFNA